MTEMNPTHELPRHTWRRWWRELPGYYRIGVWTILAVVGLHLAVVVRFYIGLQEPAEITALRERGITVGYFWEWQDDWKQERFSGERWLIAGFIGKSPRNVVIISIWNIEGTIQDLKLIGQQFSNLEVLNINGADIETQDLAHLRNCRHLRQIHIYGANVDDGIIELFDFFPKLSEISLGGTLVGDETLEALLKRPAITYIDVSYTDVSDKAVDLAIKKHHEKLTVETERHNKHHQVSEVVSVIRWSDGARTAAFNGPYELRFSIQKVDPDDGQLLSGSLQTENFTRSSSWWSLGDKDEWYGDYLTTLTLGKHTSEPVIITFDVGRALPRHVEYRMPVTREEALRSVTK